MGHVGEKSSSKDSVFVHGNRAQWTRFSNAVVRYFQQPREFKTNETQAPILTKPSHLKLYRFCIVAAAKASSFLHRCGGDSDQTQVPKASSFLHRHGGKTRLISAFCIA